MSCLVLQPDRGPASRQVGDRPDTVRIGRGGEDAVVAAAENPVRTEPRRSNADILKSGFAGVEDTVSSQWLIRAGVGKEYKPEDYLRVFTVYVQENADHIRALRILLSQPQDWGSEALTELRQALVQAPDHFTEENLRRAFEVTSHKALIDIISMVKHAAAETAPLYTAEERVNLAVERVLALRALTEDQKKWTEHIRQHLVANLSIDREDFDNVPVLSNRGGWGRANKVFDGQLADLVASLNREMVAA